jgi:glycerophosphoryl diester phosphodiesterase
MSSLPPIRRVRVPRSFRRLLATALVALLPPPLVVAQAPAPGPAIAGHRGGFYDRHPESSLALFAELAQAFAGDTLIIEVDLRRSRDGTIWIMHDATVDRTTTGSGRLDALPDSAIRALRLRRADGAHTDERVPTFAELLAFARARNLHLMLDIKEPLHEAALRMVRAQGLQGRVLTLTFDPAITARVAAFAPDIALSALIITDADWQAFQRAALRADRRVAYITNRTTPALVTTLRRAGVRIMADVSEGTRHGGSARPAAAYRAQVREQQLDILITDYPIEARAALFGAAGR